MKIRSVIGALAFTMVVNGVAMAQSESILVSDKDTLSYKYTPIEAAVSQPSAQAEVASESVVSDTTTVKKRRNVFRRVIDYFAESSVDKSFEKKMDFTFILGPSYSNSTSLSIGAMAAGLYRIDKENRALPPSTVSVFAHVSITGLYRVGIDGICIFKDDRNRLLYNASFGSQPTYFWGLGYVAATTNQATSYLSNKYHVEAIYLHRLFKNAYAGAKAEFTYAYCGGAIKPMVLEYLNGRSTSSAMTGFSLLLEYDSRDFIPNAYKGVYFSLQGMIRPKGLGSNSHTSWAVKANVAYYQKLWKDAVLAMDLYGEFNSKDTPWWYYAQMGGRQRMRGYYEGRFSDLNAIMFQAELRQRVWRRIGITVWGGAGNAFAAFDRFHWDRTMPNYGIGARWEFKKRVNIRFDYGFGSKVQGKLMQGFLISINEAF